LSGAAPCPSCVAFRQGRAALAPVSAWSVVGLGFCFFKCGVRGLVKIPFPPHFKNIYLLFVITFFSNGFMFIEFCFIATNKIFYYNFICFT
jgi:hypothetical protein